MTSPLLPSFNHIAENESVPDLNAGPSGPLSSSVIGRTLKRSSYGSFATETRRRSQFNDPDDDVEGNFLSEGCNDPGRPVIPSVLPPSGDTQSTPLPVLPMTVLSIAMLGEFLSANASAPFLLFMVKGFGTLTSNAAVSFWAGLLVATFFLTQFLTSLLWASVADKYGRRFVLVVSLLGGAITCTSFGASKTLETAMVIRLLQGVFAGSVGVAKGSVSLITDATNEGRAYAILGFCWGFGGVAGSIIGGAFERPCVKWPSVFGRSSIFHDAPYLLPCLIAGSVMLLGAFLACFLGPDGGPRANALHEKLESSFDPIIIPDETTPILERIASRNQSDSLRYHLPSLPLPIPESPALHGVNLGGRTITMSSTGTGTNYRGVYMGRTITMSSTGSYRAGGSVFRPRLARNANTAALRKRASIASSLARSGGRISADGMAMGMGMGVGDENRASMISDTSSLGFAHRLVMANENAVNNIADLWVAAAMYVDQGDPFDDDPEDEFDDDEEPEVMAGEDVMESGVPEAYVTTPRTHRGREDSVMASLSLGYPHVRSSSIVPSPHRRRFESPRPGPGPRQYSNSQTPFTERDVSTTPMGNNRFSSSIFANPGVEVLPQAADSAQMQLPVEPGAYAEREPQNLAPIFESTVATHMSDFPVTVTVVEEKAPAGPSLVSQLPLLIIAQYGFLALHSTTHDQVFMCYLVTSYENGGLNLNAGHFAQLIALMSLAQIFYQFYLYPHLGPPRGPFSHLTMFRLGSCLFVPSYLVVIYFRETLAQPGNHGDLALMTALAASVAIRFCGATFGYTSISILLNYMTPPDAVGYANGIAQSVVSLARCIGPILGGWLWSVSVENNPSGYGHAFVACACFTVVVILHSFTIR